MKYPGLIFLVLILTAASINAKTVTDQLGHRIVVPDHPVRIVSLAPSITEILFELGVSHRLCGVTRFSDYPPEAGKLPRVGSYVHLDVEKIVVLKPDLCIAVKDGNPLAVIDKLRALDIPVYAVDPRDLGAVMDTLIELGRLLGVPDTAEGVVAGMRGRIERVKRKAAGFQHRPGVFFQIGISPIVSVGTHTFINELIVMAGGENLARGPVPYPRYSMEQVLGLAPEIFIISSMARDGVFEAVKSQWQRWESLPAVKNDAIFLVDSNVFDRASPRLVDGLELLVKLIHPEITDSETARSETP